MPVEISDVPKPTRTPAFAGLTISVPLSEEPTRGWLDQLALQDLPGKGHRLSGAALELHLDRNLTDVQALMDRIADAIAKANAAYDHLQEDLEHNEAGREARRTASAERVARGLEKWWTARGPAALEAPNSTADNEPPS